MIAYIRQRLVEQYGTLEHGRLALLLALWSRMASNEDPTLRRKLVKGANKLAAIEAMGRLSVTNAQTAYMLGVILLHEALTNPKELGLIAEALRKLEDKGAVDPRAEAIITAYEKCGSFPPTFSELKRVFIARFGESRWRGDFPVRDTLRFLKLRLRKSKRGRPPGAKSVLKMHGTPQQRRKN